MIKLPVVDDSIKNKKVLVRGDIDVPLKDGVIVDDTRLKDIKPTIDLLLKNNCQVILCGHLGRPEGVAKTELSSKPIQEYFPQIKVLENLRFDPREEANDPEFAKELTDSADIYVNESFAESYREVTSIIGIPKLLPHYAGLRFAMEVEKLSKVMESPVKPMLVIIGGAKLDAKLPVIEKMAMIADNVIVGGKLVTEFKSNNLKITVLQLTPDGKDTSTQTIDAVKSLFENAKTIVWNGPVGIIEDFTYQVGTRHIAELVTHNETAFKLVGGGDTVGFVDKLGLTDKFNWVCSGGSSMLKFLAEGTLPGIQALI